MVGASSVLEIDEELLDEGLAVGSYRLVSPLGSGGMGEVWLGKHRLLARPAAVKLIRHDAQRGHAPRCELVRRFQREAQVTAELSGRRTPCSSTTSASTTPAASTTSWSCSTVSICIASSRASVLSRPERVIMLLRQACRSLAEAHERGLVHRDIKPANLFVDAPRARVRLPEGRSTSASSRTSQGRTPRMLSGAEPVTGTPAFMPPEIVARRATLDGRADLYSLACTAYWALTGQLVFQATTPTQMLLHHAQTPPVPPSRGVGAANPHASSTRS